eukprot:14078799-Alexandrium_andersonii.AAC.1
MPDTGVECHVFSNTSPNPPSPCFWTPWHQVGIQRNCACIGATTAITLSTGSTPANANARLATHASCS